MAESKGQKTIILMFTAYLMSIYFTSFRSVIIRFVDYY